MAGLFLLCAVLGVFSQEGLLSQAEVIEKKVSKENLKSWINPEDGVLATENTPVYGMRKKETPEGTPAKYEFVEYQNGMKEVVDYLRATNPDILLESTYNSSLKEEESSSESPSIIYPEVLVIIDYASYQRFNYTFYDAIEYTLAFWTGVDIKFRNLGPPKVRLNIAGILLIEHPKAIPYAYRSTTTIHAVESFEKVSKWLYEHKAFIPIESYDVAVVLTGLELIGSNPEQRLDCSSNFAETCRVDDSKKEVTKFILVKNSEGFHAIHYVTAGLAYSLGANIKYKDGGRCPEGAIGSYDWTQCTLDQFAQLHRGDKFDCVRNKPKEGKPVPRILPGKLQSLDQQCSVFIKNSNGRIIDLKGEILLCSAEVPHDSLWAPFGAAAGSSFGDGKICLQGECVEERFIH